MSTLSILAASVLLGAAEPPTRLAASDVQPLTRAIYHCRNKDRRARLTIRPKGGDADSGRLIIRGDLALGKAWTPQTMNAEIAGVDHDWVYADYPYGGTTFQILFDRRSGELTIGGSAILLAPWHLKSDRLECRVDHQATEAEG